MKILNDCGNDYIVAEGPDGLEKILDELLEKTNQDPSFAKQTHQVLYRLGNQKSVIKIDTSERPFKFLHYDLMGRPATLPIKETIARFLWEKCGEKERFIKEQTE